MNKSIGAHIMVVDDEEDVQLLFELFFRDLVESSQVRLSFSTSARECLNYLDSPDGEDIVLVLSDINMPEISGIELLEELRTQQRSIDVYMISAYENDNYISASKALGAKHYFKKPVNFNDLKQTVIDEFVLKKKSGQFLH